MIFKNVPSIVHTILQFFPYNNEKQSVQSMLKRTGVPWWSQLVNYNEINKIFLTFEE